MLRKNPYAEYTQFFIDHEAECRFIILMATNVWAILEEDMYEDYLSSYATLRKLQIVNKMYFLMEATRFIQSSIKQKYLRRIGNYQYSPCISLTLRGAWNVYNAMMSGSFGKVEEDFYDIHDVIRKHPYMEEKDLDDLKMYGNKFDGKYIQVGI